MSSDKPVNLIYGQRLTTFKHKNSNLSKDHAAFKETSNPNPCNEALIPKHTPGTYLTPQLKSYTPYTHHILLNRTERNLNSRMAILIHPSARNASTILCNLHSPPKASRTPLQNPKPTNTYIKAHKSKALQPINTCSWSPQAHSTIIIIRNPKRVQRLGNLLRPCIR